MNDKQSKSGDKRLENLSRAGRPKGVPNKATATAREAFAQLVEGNAPLMNEWLMQVAYGIPAIVIKKDKDGNDLGEEQRRDQSGVLLWLVPPAPEKALDIMQKMAEYHIPKLARTEHVGDENQPIQHVVKFQD